MPPVYFWTEDETKYLIENAGKLTARQIAVHLGRQRASVLAKARHMGISLYTPTTNQKDAAVRTVPSLGLSKSHGNILDAKSRRLRRQILQSIEASNG